MEERRGIVACLICLTRPESLLGLVHLVVVAEGLWRGGNEAELRPLQRGQHLVPGRHVLHGRVEGLAEDATTLVSQPHDLLEAHVTHAGELGRDGPRHARRRGDSFGTLGRPVLDLLPPLVLPHHLGSQLLFHRVLLGVRLKHFVDKLSHLLVLLKLDATLLKHRFLAALALCPLRRGSVFAPQAALLRDGRLTVLLRDPDRVRGGQLICLLWGLLLRITMERNVVRDQLVRF